MKASQKGGISLQYFLMWAQLHKEEIESLNELSELTFCIFFFSRIIFSKLKGTCDVNTTKGSKRNLNLLQIPTFNFDKKFICPLVLFFFFLPKFL